MDSTTRKQFDNKIIDCFHSFSDPLDRVRVTTTLNKAEDAVVLQTLTKIPLAHEMPLERFLNTPTEALKAIAKGLYKEIRVVG